MAMTLDVKSIMRKVRRIRIIANRLSGFSLAGEYHSTFKGHGIEFDEVLPYTSGDDIRSIDWNVTARMGHPYVKRFREERELTVMFLVDVSGSLSFGSGNISKAELGAEIACVLAVSAARNKDRTGLVLFDDTIRKFIRPRRGRTEVMRIVREIIAFGETGGGTNIGMALDFLNRVQRKRCVVFLISDFMDTGFADKLKDVSARHDVICCPISDPAENKLNNMGIMCLRDAESGQILEIDTSSSTVRESLINASRKKSEELNSLFNRCGIDSIPLTPSSDVVNEIRKLFRMRRRKRVNRLTS